MKLFKRNNYVLSSSFALACLISSHEVMAVGGGLPFNVDESFVDGAKINMFDADSLDLTYHACTNIGGANGMRLEENGYFWNSSCQDTDSVVDSQINYFLSNGYHIYGLYTYQAGQVAGAQPTPTGDRLNYVVRPVNAGITLHVDPFQDTTLELVDCQVVVTNDADDLYLGGSSAVAQGEKSETSGLANGDFKVVFSDWDWSPEGELLFVFGPPADTDFLVFNGNLTSLGGLLGADHNPEGSGNIFWLSEFDPVQEDD